MPQRLDPARFIAFGMLPAVNACVMALYALGLATHGRGSAADAQPVLFVLIGLCLVGALYASVLRGHDLGRPGWQTFLAFWLALAMGPVLLLFLGYLVWVRGEAGTNAYGPPPEKPGAAAWISAAVLLAVPWLVFAAVVLVFH